VVHSLTDYRDEDKIDAFDRFSKFLYTFDAEHIRVGSMLIVLNSKMILIRVILPHRAQCCIM
jgi:hypothetical protein